MKGSKEEKKGIPKGLQCRIWEPYSTSREDSYIHGFLLVFLTSWGPAEVITKESCLGKPWGSTHPQLHEPPGQMLPNRSTWYICICDWFPLLGQGLQASLWAELCFSIAAGSPQRLVFLRRVWVIRMRHWRKFSGIRRKRSWHWIWGALLGLQYAWLSRANPVSGHPNKKWASGLLALAPWCAHLCVSLPKRIGLATEYRNRRKELDACSNTSWLCLFTLHSRHLWCLPVHKSL